ncbi:MAG: ATP-binding protein [Bacteroidales bacterium]|nr:ATP-binding protein [Bacteroidales bacterium]
MLDKYLHHFLNSIKPTFACIFFTRNLVLFPVLISFCLILTPTDAQKAYIPQQPSPLTESWRWKHFPGLNGKGFADFCEAEDGTMWFGIENGLMNYDGYDWNTFLNINSDPMGEINEIVVVNSTVYVGTELGLYKYHDSVWTALLIHEKLLNFKTKALNKMSNGAVVANTTIGAMVLYKDQITLYSLPIYKPLVKKLYKNVNFIEILEHTDYDNLRSWDAIEYQNEIVITFQCIKKNRFYLKAKLNDDALNPLIIDDSKEMLNESKGFFVAMPTFSEVMNDGSLWLLSQSVPRGIAVFDGKDWKEIKLSTLFNKRNHMSGIVQMNDNTIIASGAGMLYEFKNNEWKMYTKPHIPVPTTGYLRIEKTRDGNLWVGSIGSDVYYLEYSNNNWKSFKNLSYQFETKNGEQWFLSADNKVVYQKNGRWYYFDQADGVVDYPQKLIQTSNGETWCAGSTDEVTAVSIYNGKKWNHFKHDSLSWGIEKRSMYEHTDGSVWISSPSGSRLIESNPQKAGILIGKKTGDEEYNWRIIHRGSIAVDGIGLSKNNKVYFSSFYQSFCYSGEDSLAIVENFVGKRSRLVSSPGRLLWFGTEDKGLFRFDGMEYTRYKIGNGLISNTIIDIYPETDTTVWVVTEKDISFYDGETWINHSLPKKFIFEKRGGSIDKGTNGTFWITLADMRWNLRSFNRDFDYTPSDDFYTYQVKRDRFPPMVSVSPITDIVDESGNLFVRWSGKDYYNQTPSSRLLFSYKLDDNDWSKYRYKQNHTFLSLPSGKHTLWVKAKDKSGNESLSAASVSFFVKHPVWKRPWFIILMGSMMLIIISLLYRVIKRNQSLASLNSILSNANIQLEQQKLEIKTQNEALQLTEEETQQLNEELKTSNEYLKERTEKLKQAIDELKNTQAQLVQSEKMASVGVLMAGIAHEINNPLNFINGGKVALEDYIDATLPNHTTEIYPLLDMIEEGVQRAAKIVHSLNRFSRSNEETTENCDIHSIIDNCLVILNHQLKDKVELKKIFNAGQFIVLGNEGKLHQVFLNVIGNAEQAIVKVHGVISILTFNIEDSIKIVISDTGHGIKKENMKRITDPFFTTKEPGQGTGMGLSISYQIINEHHGNLAFDSKPGIGTNVIITLPFKD